MRCFRSFAAAAVLAASVGMAAAADMPPPPVPMLPPPPPPVEFASGWYLRGDVGVGITSPGDWRLDEPVVLSNGVSVPGNGFLNKGIDDAFIFGVGVGYQFNSWLRFDLTGEYRTATGIKGTESYPFDCAYNPFGSCAGGGNPKQYTLNGVTVVNRYNIFQGSISSFVGLANVYFDLGTWWGLTPFVGVGGGFAHNRVRNVTDYDPSEFGGGGFAAGGSKTNFAWALHAGVGYDINPNLKLELSYRYLNMGSAETGRLYCLCGGSISPLRIDDIDSHDLRLGMRWVFNAPPVYAPPVIAKY
jgi:opacity protein-like surface antigen